MQKRTQTTECPGMQRANYNDFCMLRRIGNCWRYYTTVCARTGFGDEYLENG